MALVSPDPTTSYLSRMGRADPGEQPGSAKGPDHQAGPC